jgi:ribulose-phosphate 3-epimerase
VKIAPSIIAADFSKLPEEIQQMEQAGVEILHLDIMDGVFVPNLTFGPMIVQAINQLTEITLWSHLMIVEPGKYLGQFIKAGSDWISFHVEATEKIKDNVDYIHKQNKKAGLAINPSTPFDKIKDVVNKLDFLLIMTVNPGFYGQKFLQEVLPKIRQARAWLDEHAKNCLLTVDGGVNKETIDLIKEAGVDIAVAGAAVFKAPDYQAAIRELAC